MSKRRRGIYIKQGELEEGEERGKIPSGRGELEGSPTFISRVWNSLHHKTKNHLPTYNETGVELRGRGGRRKGGNGV